MSKVQLYCVILVIKNIIILSMCKKNQQLIMKKIIAFFMPMTQEFSCFYFLLTFNFSDKKCWKIELKSILEIKAPLMHCVIFTEGKQCFWIKIICGFLFGFIVGMAFYEFILVGLAFERGTVFVLGLVFTAILAGGCAVSSQVVIIRCITLLTIPSFSGKAGRHIVKAMIISTVVTGPIVNIGTNIEEIIRMYSCSNSLAYNLSQARYDLLVKPFKIAFLSTKVNTEELKDMLGSVKNVVEPFAQEIEGIDDIKFIQEENDYMDQELNDTKRSKELFNKYKSILRSKRSEEFNSSFGNNAENYSESASEYQQKYYSKLETRCENVKTGMGKMCRKRFSKFKEQCDEAVHWAIAWAVCWPMKLDFICDLVKMFTYGDYDCDPSSMVSGGIGEGYVKLLNSGQVMRASVAEERTQYKLIKPPNMVGIYSAATITKEFVHDMYTKKTFADALLTLVKTMLAFMFILVIKNATEYHNSFIRFTDFDNIYLTAEFRILDAQRRKLKKPTLLPQTKAEKKRVADPYSLCLGRIEREVGSHLILIIAMFLVCSVILFMDFVLAKSLQWIQENLEFSYSESGQHSFRIDVKGIGFVAALVRSIIKSFNFKKEMKGDVSNKVCLPNPIFLSGYDYLKVYGSCMVLVLLAYGEGYIRRIRRAICAFYYQEQEKRRIETLYRKTLAMRHRLFQRQLESIQKKAKEMEVESDLRIGFRLQKRFPKWKWLRVLPSVRPLCVICEEEEVLFTRCGPKHQSCLNCGNFYCPECWTNFYFTCVLCESKLLDKNQEGKVEIDMSES